MIKFFRKIRHRLLAEKKLSKYLLYAIGEIVLVVIGILIALQINNWNLERQFRKKERAYLQEIQNNLRQDSLRLQAVVDFNKNKRTIVADMLFVFADSLTNKERFEIFNKNANNFTYYEVFDPVKTAFNNMLSAESIALIENTALRESLSTYYNFPYLEGVQNRIAVINRRVVDEHYPKFFTREFVSARMGISSEMPPVEAMDIALDQYLMSDLFGIKIILGVQDELIYDTQQHNQDLLARLHLELNE